MVEPDPVDTPRPAPPILLIGLRGAGKSCVCRAAASLLGRIGVDLDGLSPHYLGELTPADALRKHGEEAFRKAEAAALADLLGPGLPRPDSMVLALGGGTPTAPGAADTLRAARAAGAKVVYLRATAATLLSRLEADPGDRPPLTGLPPVDEIHALLAARDPLYRDLADLVVDVDALCAEEVAERIAAAARPCEPGV